MDRVDPPMDSFRLPGPRASSFARETGERGAHALGVGDAPGAARAFFVVVQESTIATFLFFFSFFLHGVNAECMP